MWLSQTPMTCTAFRARRLLRASRSYTRARGSTDSLPGNSDEMFRLALLCKSESRPEMRRAASAWCRGIQHRVLARVAGLAEDACRCPVTPPNY